MPRSAIAVTIAALALPLTLAACGSTGSDRRARGLDPGNFVRVVDNPWYPLRPGTNYRYRGVKDGKPATDVVSVTDETRTILGIAATVVHDRLYLEGKLAEDTLDWYAQDRRGNVWYLGEATRELDSKGRLESTEGSWQAGVDGAEAGVFMPAEPKVGQKFRQEYYKGQAEDQFQILSLDSSVDVPYVSSSRALKTREWTPLEPDVVDAKYYVRGTGTVSEATVKGGDERLELVSLEPR